MKIRGKSKAVIYDDWAFIGKDFYLYCPRCDARFEKKEEDWQLCPYCGYEFVEGDE